MFHFESVETNPDKVFLISDLHLGHRNILKYEPIREKMFGTIDNMNVRLVDNINKNVPNDCQLIILGDLFFGKSGKEALHKIDVYQKHLILGNHDDLSPERYIREFGFNTVNSMMQFDKIIFTHIPIHIDEIYCGRYLGNVHGHIHGRVINDRHYFNVCCERVNFTPICLTEIINFFKENNLN